MLCVSATVRRSWMSRLGGVCFLSLLVGIAITAIAQNSNFVGTWKLDVPQSDFGHDPAFRSGTCTCLKDAPELASWHCRVVDHDGKVMSYSWGGPKDGTVHPRKDSAGKVMSMDTIKQQADGSLILHQE